MSTPKRKHIKTATYEGPDRRSGSDRRKTQIGKSARGYQPKKFHSALGVKWARSKLIVNESDFAHMNEPLPKEIVRGEGKVAFWNRRIRRRPRRKKEETQ